MMTTVLDIQGFMVYLFGVSIAVLVYLQWRILRKKRKEAKPADPQTLEMQHQAPPAAPKDVMFLRRTMRPNSSNSSLVELTDADDDAGGDASSSGYASTPRISRMRRPDSSRRSTADAPWWLDTQESNSGVDQDDVEEYISFTQQTASVGHEGASLYARLGCLGECVVMMCGAECVVFTCRSQCSPSGTSSTSHCGSTSS